MKISSIHLANFKRFNDLEIKNISNKTKLVLLIGSNGSGKSCLFDAFSFADSEMKRERMEETDFKKYFKKDASQNTHVKIMFGNQGIEFSDNLYQSKLKKLNHPQTLKLSANQRLKMNFNQITLFDMFYGRTSFRQIARLTRTSLGQGQPIDFQDADRPKFFIDRDCRFENDIEKMTELILRDLFTIRESGEVIYQKYVYPINVSLQRIFGEQNGTRLELIEIIPPLEGKTAQITFRKGNSTFHYDYLSAGEKEVFNLIFNLMSRTHLYQDTIYYLDEMDLHLNTRLQYNLLQEIVEHWIPINCQLWTASHSLGFIEYASQSETAAIIDFDNYNFDHPRVLTPVPKENPNIYEIAVGKDFLPSLLKYLNIYFVENKDRDYYAAIGLAETIFVSANNRNSVFHKARTSDMKGVVDRYFLTDEDIQLIENEYLNLKILPYYSIENYLYHPDNLQEYYDKKGKIYDKNNYIEQLIVAKNQIKDAIVLQIVSSRGTYPYFGEPIFNKNPVLQNRFKIKEENYAQSAEIQKYLNSNDLELFYKSFQIKIYATQVLQRQNVAKTDLAKTNWFKMQMEKILM
jgi:predicted ATP-binding protein involved in virulence